MALTFSPCGSLADKELETVLYIDSKIKDWRETSSRMHNPPRMTEGLLIDIQSALDVFKVELRAFNELHKEKS